MPRELTQKDINDIIAVKSGITTTTYRRIRENELRLIISELQNNSYIKLQDFGEFKVKHEGGKDEIFLNEFGVPEKRYVEPKDFVEFIPNKNFIELLNGQRITTMSKKALMKEREDKQKERNQNYQYHDYVDETEGNKLDGMILEMAKKRKDLNERNAIYWNTGIYQRKKQDNRAKKVKYDGVVYDSISEMAEATGITKRRICYALKNKKRKFLDGKEISLV